MSWLSDYRADVGRYAEYAGGRAFVQIMSQQGLWALLVYRVAHA